MGPRPDPQLEHRRLDHAVAADRRQDRPAGRRRSRRADRRGFHLGQPVQGAQRRHRAGRRRRPWPAPDRVGAHQFPDRSLHRRHAGPGARVRADAGRRRRPAGASRRAGRGADADPCQLPHRLDAPDARVDRRRPRRRGADDLGPGALGRRGAGRSHRRLGRFRRRLRLQVPERRTGRAGVHLGPSPPHRADGSGAVAAAAVGLARARRAVRVHPRLPSGRRRVALHLRHAADALAGGARVRGRHGAGGGGAGRHRCSAPEVDRPQRPLHRAGRVALRRPRPDAGDAARQRRPRQPGGRRASDRRLRDDAGADRARRRSATSARPTSCASA